MFKHLYTKIKKEDEEDTEEEQNSTKLSDVFSNDRRMVGHDYGTLDTEMSDKEKDSKGTGIDT